MSLGKGFYRFLGIVAATAAIVESTIWIILSLFGIVCYYTDCGALPKSTAFGRAFNLVYLNTEESINSPCIDPIFFHVIMWLYLMLSIVWELLSVYLLFCTLKNSKKHRLAGPIWITFTMFLSVVDSIVFGIFTADFHRSLETNFHMEYVASPMERSNFDCVFRRMYDFDNPKGEYTPEERSMIKLSIANEKARLSEKMNLLNRLSETLNTFFIANKRNPLLLPPKLKTPPPKPTPASIPPLPPPPGIVANSDDLDIDHASDLLGHEFDEVTLIGEETEPENIDSRLQKCNRRFRQYRTRIGARMMVAPAAVMMTLSMRGYILWLFNICMALALWQFYLYKQRETFLRRFSI